MVSTCPPSQRAMESGYGCEQGVRAPRLFYYTAILERTPHGISWRRYWPPPG